MAIEKQDAIDFAHFTLELRKALLFGKAQLNIVSGKFNTVRGTTELGPELTQAKEILETQRKNIVPESYNTSIYPDGFPKEKFNQKPQPHTVSIIDLGDGSPNQERETIDLLTIPRELNWNSESNYAVIRPLGRNNPWYHFTGSEDKLEFEIDWYSVERNREDVIKSCRKLEALSKTDGYGANPHKVLLKWGNDDKLFSGMRFIVKAAPYRLTHFNGYQRQDKQIVSTQLLPIQAYQKMILLRVTDYNLNYEDIRRV